MSLDELLIQAANQLDNQILSDSSSKSFFFVSIAEPTPFLKTIADNLALSCQTCNNYKYNKTEAPNPATEQLALLFHPQRMDWHQHFIWNEDATQMLGVTPIGRATVALLQTNRDGVMNIAEFSPC